MYSTALRADFPILNEKINGKPVVYLDSAATSLKPRQVIDAERYYYEHVGANVHRGLHALSEAASRVHEEAHAAVAKFVGAKKVETVFVRNATEGLNLVMYSLANSNYFKRGDKILISALEHHSNIVPWQHLTQTLGVKLEYVELTPTYELDMIDFEKKVAGAKLVSMSGAAIRLLHFLMYEPLPSAHNAKARLCVLTVRNSSLTTPLTLPHSGATSLPFPDTKCLRPREPGHSSRKKSTSKPLPRLCLAAT